MNTEELYETLTLHKHCLSKVLQHQINFRQSYA